MPWDLWRVGWLLARYRETPRLISHGPEPPSNGQHRDTIYNLLSSQQSVDCYLWKRWSRGKGRWVLLDCVNTAAQRTVLRSPWKTYQLWSDFLCRLAQLDRNQFCNIQSLASRWKEQVVSSRLYLHQCWDLFGGPAFITVEVLIGFAGHNTWE